MGTGLSVFVEGPDFTLLYDAGSNDDLAVGSGNRVLAYLKAAAPTLTRLDHVLLSHPHRDHVELMADVVAAYDVGAVWDAGVVNDICGYRRLLEAIAKKPTIDYHTAAFEKGDHVVAVEPCEKGGAPSLSLHHGDPIAAPSTIPLGRSAQLTVLHADGKRHSGDFNRNSLVVRLDLGDVRVLLMGDAEAGERADPKAPPHKSSVEGQLLACCRAELRADLLVVGHHGSKTSSRDAFLDAVQPRYAVISSGPTHYDKVVLPDAEIVTSLEKRARLYRTTLHDAACGQSVSKIGPRHDGQPGGATTSRSPSPAARSSPATGPEVQSGR